MKNHSISLQTVLLAALGATFLAGCATYNDTAQANLPSGYVRSQLTVSPLTSPVERVKWSQYSSSLKAIPMLRSLDTYAFVAPEGTTPTANQSTSITSVPPGTIFVEPAGAATGNQELFLHTPGQR